MNRVDDPGNHEENIIDSQHRLGPLVPRRYPEKHRDGGNRLEHACKGRHPGVAAVE
jgi:hypothetical protein